MLLGFSLLGLFGYSYMNDIKEQKGRKTRKVFMSTLQTSAEKLKSHQFGVARLEAHDPSYTKYLHKKERAAVHHH